MDRLDGTRLALATRRRLVDPERLRVERVPELPEEVGRFAKRAPDYATGVRVPLPSLPGHEVVKPIAKAEPPPPDGAPSAPTFEVVTDAA